MRPEKQLIIEDLKAQVVVISGEGDRAFSAGVDVADHNPGMGQKGLNNVLFDPLAINFAITTIFEYRFPRCLAQFTTSQGVCDDCGGLALVGFSADESASKRRI